MLKDIIFYLNDSFLVSRIQTFFGIKKLDDKHHVIDNRFFYYFFNFITHFGNEIFYILFLPIMAWNYDDRVVYLTCLAWALNMYIGQASKEYFQMSRPLSPPVVRLEDRYELEYGFPSTHAMAALSISISFLRLHFDIEFNSDKFWTILITCFICISICLSRIYLGMHSILDILGGILFSLILTFIFIPFNNIIHQFIIENIKNGLMLYLSGILVCLFYPKTDKWSTARADTILIMGVASGLILGMSLKHYFHLQSIGKLTNSSINTKILRTIFGTICIFFTRFSCKSLINFIVFNILHKKSSNSLNLKDLIRKNFYFELFFYFFTYSCVSFNVIFGCFFIFEWFNLK